MISPWSQEPRRDQSMRPEKPSCARNTDSKNGPIHPDVVAQKIISTGEDISKKPTGKHFDMDPDGEFLMELNTLHQLPVPCYHSVQHHARRPELELKMKLKQLEGLLGSLTQFDNPKIELEQYPTGPHIASRLLFTAENSFGDLRDKVVADFGCGCGTLGLAAGLLGAEHIIGYDIDPESIEIASSNAEDLDLNMDFVQCDIRNLKLSDRTIDTVVMNPPFGTRKKGADMDFLSVALKVASRAVYSLHKSTTRDYIKRTVLREYNVSSAEVLCELRFDVPQLYKFHKKKEVDVAVDLWRFVPKPDSVGKQS
ncbi:hypothetical protein ACS0TY_022095 [Phlomoides rotata]